MEGKNIGEGIMDKTAEMIIIYTTLPSENDARTIGAELVEARLAACVNILPGMVSIYRWQDATETASETVMLVKAPKALEAQLLAALAARHPYSVPALIVVEPSSVGAPYLAWLYNQTSAQR
jgi:periplasmic divalent cation tolerance protein